MTKVNETTIIWIDKLFFSKDNESKQNKIKINFNIRIPTSVDNLNTKEENDDYNVRFYKIIKEAIMYLKTLRFNYTIIVVSGNLFESFVNEFKNNLKDIYVIPIIIIFKKKECCSLLNKIANLCKKSIDYEKYYNFGGIYSSFAEIKFYIDSLMKKRKSKNYNLHEILGKKKFLKDVKYLFDPVREDKDLILPIFYQILIDICETKTNYHFIHTMFQEYYSNQRYNKLLRQIINIPVDANIPVELLSKYYARIYTFGGDFYKKMKANLLNDNNEDNIIYQPYIKTLYEGAKKGALKPSIGIKLYSAQLLNEKEIQELINYKKNKKKGLPMAIIFSKAFISFSKRKNIAENFFRWGKNTFITIEDAKKEYYLFTHADIEELSIYKNEKEVLFFPFSAFGIDDFKFNDESKRYEMKLIYLGKYIKKFEENKSFDTSNDGLPNSKFKKYLEKSGLIEKEKINNIKVKDVLQQYKHYKEQNINIASGKKKYLFFLLIIPLILIIISISLYIKKLKFFINCEEGLYFDSKTKECLPCRAGYYSKQGAKKCTKCMDGYSSDFNSSFCFMCPAGTYSNKYVDNCFICKEGYYSKEGSSFCRKCQGGTYSNIRGAKMCITCEAGYYSEEGSTACLKCKLGTFSEKGASNCLQCPDGAYSNFTGATSCIDCPAGMTSNKNKTSCISCQKGYYSNKSGSKCSKCPGGYYSNSTGSISCNSCPEGTYSSSNRELCVPCEKGYYSNKTS